MGNFGYIAIFLTMIFSALGGALVLGAQKESAREKAGEGLLLAAAAAGAASLLILVSLFLNHDYRVAYVHNYADRNMGVGYLITAVWGGQAGSLLFWAVLQTFYTAAVVLFAKSKPKVALGFLATLQVYFFALVLFHSNPFEPLGRIATSGMGMNPLLLNPYMAFHPPTLFLGFVGFSVPVAYVFAALAEPEAFKDDAWIDALRPFILFAWLFLSIGNLLGMVWAYQELGWGGYWGWDPVENASFMPWLTATALVHTATMQKKKKLFRLLNPILMVLTFSLIVFGTFITRSGVIESVHAFSDATVGPYLLGLIIFQIALFTILSVRARKYLTSNEAEGGILSRENLFLFAAWIFLISAAFIWIGTMAPLFTELFKGEKVASTPEFFNRWMVPLGLAILALLAICLVVGKQGVKNLRPTELAPFLKRATLPIAIGVLTSGAGTALLGVGGAAPLFALFMLGMAAAGIVRELLRLFAVARREGGGFSAGRRRRLGAHIVHFSVLLLFLGFTGEAYTTEVSKVMKAGDTLAVGDFELEFEGLREENDYRRYAIFSDLLVRKSGWTVGTFSAARMFYHSHPNQPTSEVAIRTTLSEDLFLILGRINEQNGDASIRAVINPLVAWIWIGGLVLILGTLIGFQGAPAPSTTPRPKTQRLVNALLAMMPLAALAVVAVVARPADTALTLAASALVGTILLCGNAVLGIAASMEERG